MLSTAAETIQANNEAPIGWKRYDSIDQARGLIMILMALDHVRFFFTNISAYPPESLVDTNIWLFLTRWVTHYCAPGFFLLAGLGIFLYGAKIENDAKLIKYLLSRGLFLVVLEFTVVGYSWIFTPGYSFAGVIWSLGCSFIIMAALVKLPRLVLLTGSAAIMLLHNFVLDGVNIIAGGWTHFFWRIFYQPGTTAVPGIIESYFVLFPIVPWLAMMVFGYALGDYYLRCPIDRRRTFVSLGTGMIIAFALLRLFGSFGTPETLWSSASTSGLFSFQPEFSKTIVSFLNTEKYPASLQYTLMTLGPIILWLGLSKLDSVEKGQGKISGPLILFGRLPLFYYICHLYVIHMLALIITTVGGQPNDWVGFGAATDASRQTGYGFDLWFVYVILGVSIWILYRLCRWFEEYKRAHTYIWLKYL